jgi:hypothetical protein
MFVQSILKNTSIETQKIFYYGSFTTLMPTFEDLLQGCQIWVDCGGSSNGRG